MFTITIELVWFVYTQLWGKQQHACMQGCNLIYLVDWDVLQKFPLLLRSINVNNDLTFSKFLFTPC